MIWPNSTIPPITLVDLTKPKTILYYWCKTLTPHISPFVLSSVLNSTTTQSNMQLTHPNTKVLCFIMTSKLNILENPLQDIKNSMRKKPLATMKATPISILKKLNSITTFEILKSSVYQMISFQTVNTKKESSLSMTLMIFWVLPVFLWLQKLLWGLIELVFISIMEFSEIWSKDGTCMLLAL